MKNTIFFGLVCFFALQANAQTVSKNFIDQPYSEFSGTALLQIVPDEIFLRIVLKEKDNKDKSSVAVQEKQMLEVLTEIGIDLKEQLSIVDQASNLRDYWIKSDEVVNTKQFELLLNDAKTVGEVFKGLETIEIRSISVNRVSHTKLTEYRRQVKIDAIKAAKSKAEDMTAALDQKLGPAIYIEEIQVNNNLANNRRDEIRIRSNYINSNSLGQVQAEFDQEQPTVEFEKIQLRAKVLVRFTLPQ
ncbi:MAG: SIMPL domain-containing protein [Bacteroidia bacterium]